MKDLAEISDQEVFDAFRGVLIDRDNIQHYRGLLAQRFLVNRCGDCGRWIYPHRPMCPSCLSWEVSATEVSGRGHVFTFTLIQQERDPNSILREPLVAAAIELEEQAGLRYLAPIVNIPVTDIAIGMPVKLTWIERDDQMAPAFEPAGEGR